MKKIIIGLLALWPAISAFSQPEYPVAQPVPNLVKGEYFVDHDPGYGNGNSFSLPAGTAVNSQNVSVDINGLTPGFHRVFIRVLDANGKWSVVGNRFFDNYFVPAYPSSSPAKNIVAIEYFIDTDPGLGAATSVPVNPSPQIEAASFVANITGLAPGAHRIFVRSKDEDGKWSITNFGIFDNSFQLPYPSAPPAPGNINRLEYYVDADPGFGNGTSIAITPAADIQGLSVDVPVQGLTAGTHTLYIRSLENPWSISAYADFMFGSTLPVTWQYVKAELIANDAKISWTTGTEENTLSFWIEHSADGINYSKVGEVAAAGSSSSARSYSFVHQQLATGLNYYRIRQVDIDGAFSYSKVVTVLWNNNLRETVVAPNPVRDIVHITEPADTWVGSVGLYSNTGSLIRNKVIGAKGRVVSISVSDLPAGVYILRVQYKETEKSFRIVKP